MSDAPSPDAAPSSEVAPLHEVETTTAGSHIVGMSFSKVTRAEEVLLALVHLQQEGEIVLSDAVVVWKDDNEKVHIRQTIDQTPVQGAMTGSIWGMLAGLLFATPVFLAAAAVGAGGGALLAKLIDLGLDDKWVKEVGRWLDPGTSALLLLVEADVRPAVLAELRRYEGQVLYCTFPDAVRAELERALGEQR